ncbi:receptor-like protein EIX2 isoform X3 [Trifolium pratense]|uniref:receptor-like protein EIX2 isoform X3 n=1 Tax=Trifolium pratense TaxID=57577 RepID=UPI001E692742|nr:receptor-like protein EIX2 isoform X3 [Trifolium pratense]
MMTIITTQIPLLLLLLLSLTTFHKCMSINDHKLVRCNEKDKETLSIFRKGINDSFGLLSTWSTEKDCCAWKGVSCDNITNRVTKLDLKLSPYFDPFRTSTGEINMCILELEFLSYLDLSDNDFDVISFTTIQHNITHASNLFYLDLSDNDLQMDNLDWLSPHSSLKYLYLSGIDLHKVTNWLQAVNTLPSLLELQLSYCNLNNFIINPSIEYLNLSSLLTLDLSVNNITSQLPNWFFNLTKDLTYLNLRDSNIHGEIPSSLLNLQNLRYLELSYNQLQGSLPDGISQLPNIQHLDLSYNKLQGSLPDGISQLPNIQHLDLNSNMLSGSNIPSTLENLSSLNYLSIGGNNFSGEISENTFSKLSNLDWLDLASSNFVFQFNLDWVPPFQLSDLLLSNTNQGPNFPSWIYTQKSLQSLDLSSSGISLVDTNKFSSLIERIPYLFLSNNSLTGDISNLTLKGDMLYLNRNNFTGGLPNISPNAGGYARDVDFSYNSFSGSIPHSWKNSKYLTTINLWNNKLSGAVLEHVSDWTQLGFLNLGENEFSGTIRFKMSQYLSVLILRANQFEGTIPTQLFNQSSLFHLDLAHNKLSGSMPKCIYNLTEMVTLTREDSFVYGTLELFTKGQEYYMEYADSIRKTIDLSANNLSGEVPSELFHLVQAQTLNLSHNNLIGKIPKTIGGMKNLESLDLSNNKLSGEIPQSMALLTFLEVLNLSCNNFDGKIPIGTQLQGFNVSSYIGNPNLCGAPLNNCTTEEENPKNATPSTDNDSIRESLYLGMGVGFAAGFWGICGSLFLIRKWRHACFRFVDGVGDKLYVTLMVKLNSFRRN